jgi:hypothetical protein
MSGRIEEDAKRPAGLMFVLDGAQGEDGFFREVQVVYHEVEVQLLRHDLTGPLWPRKVKDALNAQRVAATSGSWVSAVG